MKRGFHDLEHAVCTEAWGWDTAMLPAPDGLACMACGYREDTAGTGLLADAFDLKHRQWGLRGDPHVWGAMRESLGQVPTPAGEGAVEAALLAAFAAAAGFDLATAGPDPVHVVELDHGGMSGGFVDVRWWRAKGIPLMVARAMRPPA